MCCESIDRARSVIEDMIQQTFLELETGGNVRFEYGKPSDPWLALQCSLYIVYSQVIFVSAVLTSVIRV